MVKKLQRYKNALVDAESAKNALEDCIADLEAKDARLSLLEAVVDLCAGYQYVAETITEYIGVNHGLRPWHDVSEIDKEYYRSKVIILANAKTKDDYSNEMQKYTWLPIKSGNPEGNPDHSLDELRYGLA